MRAAYRRIRFSMTQSRPRGGIKELAPAAHKLNRIMNSSPREEGALRVAPATSQVRVVESPARRTTRRWMIRPAPAARCQKRPELAQPATTDDALQLVLARLDSTDISAWPTYHGAWRRYSRGLCSPWRCGAGRVWTSGAFRRLRPRDEPTFQLRTRRGPSPSSSRPSCPCRRRPIAGRRR
jgi:hypothetical protein